MKGLWRRRPNCRLVSERVEDAAVLPAALFLREVVQRRHPVVASVRAEREGEPLSLEQAGAVGRAFQASVDADGVRQVLLRGEGDVPILLSRRHGGGAFNVSAAAPDSASADRAAAEAAAAICIERREHDERTSVAFWSGPGDAFLGAATPRWRRLELPRFVDVEANYRASARRRLAKLVAQTSGAALPGRIALWHGPPGTGKTWALRALGREWSEWCDLHYITDPERLLGGDTSYMLSVLAGRSDPLGDEDEPGDGSPGGEAGADRWRLLVLEDAGELLGIGAPTEVGRGFARLLNVADGILGQGSKALVLVTTNEPLGRLHPAALRPGRAMATIEFGPLATEEANAWLRARGADAEVEAPTTIAELHGLLDGNGRSPSPTRLPVGFG